MTEVSDAKLYESSATRNLTPPIKSSRHFGAIRDTNASPIYIYKEDLFVTTKAKAAGLSAARLETLDRFIQSRYIDAGKIPVR